uniref:DNA primase/polymerase bifunctional N-terminal domain-containing protein n=1 Tax=Mycena chlorophos TaxID=658473 RepID=A0ABQ0KTU2_MYCCL|nr:predicted protein [Mycena chlorophos]
MGIKAFKFRVPAVRAELIGTYDTSQKELFRPDIEAIAAALPHWARKAFQRHGGRFWHHDGPETYFDGEKFHGRTPHIALDDSRGGYMLTLYALPVSEPKAEEWACRHCGEDMGRFKAVCPTCGRTEGEMNIHEISEKFGISLVKLRRMNKAGVLHCTSAEGHEHAPNMRQYLADNRPLSAVQLLALIGEPSLYAEMRGHRAKAKAQVDALGDYAADAPPVSLMRSIRDAADKDPDAIADLIDWLLRVLPGAGVPYAWIAVRAVQQVKNPNAQEELLGKFAKALHFCRTDPRFAPFVTDRQNKSRTVKIYSGKVYQQRFQWSEHMLTIFQSITTKYHGPGNVRGARITAKASAGHKLTVRYDHSKGTDENHRDAAMALAEKLGWSGDWVMGNCEHGIIAVLDVSRNEAAKILRAMGSIEPRKTAKAMELAMGYGGRPLSGHMRLNLIYDGGEERKTILPCGLPINHLSRMIECSTHLVAIEILGDWPYADQHTGHSLTSCNKENPLAASLARGLRAAGGPWVSLLPDQLAGVKVFPIIGGTKDPAVKHGWHDASDDPAQIEIWQKALPGCNWGVACGPSGLFVFDIDPDGLDWWASLLKRDDEIRAHVERAYTVRTPKGGLHVYFKGEGPSTARRIGPGIDTRGGIRKPDGKIVSGGYTVLPGSKTVPGPGRVAGTYEALGGELLPLPTCMSSLVPERKRTDTFGLEKLPDQDLPRNIKTAADLIESYISSGRVSVEGQGGNNTAFQVCASILDKAISPGLCFELLWEKWNPHCVPPWDEFELETLVRNAAVHGEDTATGVKGHQSNQDAFAAFTGHEPAAGELSSERAPRTRLQFIHDYADSVGDPEWLIDGVLPRRGVGMLYGESGSFKSFLALDWALTLAFGIPGQWGNKSDEKQDVLYFAGEAPVGMAKKRFPAWMDQWGQEFRNDHRLIFKDRVPFYSDKDGWEDVKLDLSALNARPSLIIIDTLSRLMTSMDENTSKDGTTIMNFLEDLARWYDCFVLFIHHTGKDASKGHRGSYVYFANADTVMSTSKVAGGMKFQAHKHKDADVEESIKFFEVKPSLDSIVLMETNNRPEEPQGNSRPVVGWATAKEVCEVLTTVFAGETTTTHLAQHMAREYGVEITKATRILSSTGELALFRNGSIWTVPGTRQEQEFDL